MVNGGRRGDKYIIGLLFVTLVSWSLKGFSSHFTYLRAPFHVFSVVSERVVNSAQHNANFYGCRAKSTKSACMKLLTSKTIKSNLILWLDPGRTRVTLVYDTLHCTQQDIVNKYKIETLNTHFEKNTTQHCKRVELQFSVNDLSIVFNLPRETPQSRQQ